MAQIKWENGFACQPFHNCRVSVDGVDFRVREPQPFNPKWYSRKFNDPGLRHEVGLCIMTGGIAWAHGPFPCGSYSDLKNFA